MVVTFGWNKCSCSGGLRAIIPTTAKSGLAPLFRKCLECSPPTPLPEYGARGARSKDVGKDEGVTPGAFNACHLAL
jgi:hypothetical protein